LLRDLPLPEGIPIISDTHNVEFDVLDRISQLADSFAWRQYARCQMRATFDAEGRAVRRVDLLLANSDRDCQIFKRSLHAEHVEIIPNGVDINEFSPSRTFGEPATILFTGLMSYYPNQQAIRWFLDEVFPLIQRRVPEAKLVVAGARPPARLIARRSSSVEITGTVRDMRPYFERARLVVAPLKIGGGTRVKILEAQAMARPVVSTTLGAEGLNVRNGHSILIADEPADFADQVVYLLSDDEFAVRVGVQGREHVVSHYDWSQIGDQLEKILRSTVGLTSRYKVKSQACCDLAVGASHAAG